MVYCFLIFLSCFSGVFNNILEAKHSQGQNGSLHVYMTSTLVIQEDVSQIDISPPEQPDSKPVTEAPLTEQPSSETSEGRNPPTSPPWYTDATNIISSLAFLVSGVTAVYTIAGQNAQAIREKKEELRSIVVALADSRESFNNQASGIFDPVRQEYAGRSFNSRQQLYLESAEAIIAKIPKHVSWVEYWYLANEYWFVANYRRAKLHYNNSARIASQTTPVNHATVLRSVAWMYYQPGVMRDLDRGSGIYQKILSLLSSSSDPYYQYALASTYEVWGFLEIGCELIDKGKTHVETARELYKKLPVEYPLRNQALSILDNKLSSTLSGVAWRYFRTDVPLPNVRNARIIEARNFYAEAINLLKYKVEPSSVMALGYVYESWGYSEVLNGYEIEGRQYLSEARKVYETLPLDFQGRSASLERLSISESHAINERMSKNY